MQDLPPPRPESLSVRSVEGAPGGRSNWRDGTSGPRPSSLPGEDLPHVGIIVSERGDSGGASGLRTPSLRPTPEGLAALALSGFLFLLATNLIAGGVFFLVAFLLALLIVGGVPALRGVRHLRVEVGPVPPAVEGGMGALPGLVQSSRTLRFVRLAAVVGGQRGETFLPVVERGAKRQPPRRLAAPAPGVDAPG